MKVCRWLSSIVCVVTLGMAAGCGSNQATRTSSTEGARRRRGAGDLSGGFDDSAGAKQMQVQNEVGVYESADIDEQLADHMDEVRSCYRRAGRAQRYAGGKVTLRFLVGGDGIPKDVLVVGSDLGNYDVERCLVAVGRRVQFPAPEGHKATSFEYPVEFRSTREIQVQDLNDSLKVDRDVASAMHTLSACGRVSRTGGSAIFYVNPNGAVGSVGLAADSILNEPAAACTVREIRHWRMSATLPGRMLRCRATLPGTPPSTEARRVAAALPLTVAPGRSRR